MKKYVKASIDTESKEAMYRCISNIFNYLDWDFPVQISQCCDEYANDTEIAEIGDRAKNYLSKCTEQFAKLLQKLEKLKKLEK